MTERLDVIAVGGRLAVLIPEEVAQRIGAAAGGSVEAEFRAPDGDLSRWMTSARRVMDEDAEALAVLAR